jgi:hypothetical protein
MRSKSLEIMREEARRMPLNGNPVTGFARADGSM